MKQLTVLSRKGGTGKTTLIGALTSLAHNQVLADCDVDAADFFLILEAKTLERGDFYLGQKPSVDSKICTECRVCTRLCRYEAMKDGRVDLWSAKDVVCVHQQIWYEHSKHPASRRIL